MMTKVQAARLLYGLSRPALAKFLRMSQAALDNREKRRTPFTKEDREALTNLLRIDPSSCFDEGGFAREMTVEDLFRVVSLL